MRTVLVLASLLWLTACVTPAVPSCSSPARLTGRFDGTAGYFVRLKEVRQVPNGAAGFLARKYNGYSPGERVIFVHSLSRADVANLRCEPDVDHIEHNMRTVS